MGGKCGNRTEDKAAESHEGADAGRAGRPRGVIEGLYITGREGSDLSIDCDTDGYFAVSGRFCQRVFLQKNPKNRLYLQRKITLLRRMKRTKIRLSGSFQMHRKIRWSPFILKLEPEDQQIQTTHMREKSLDMS